MASGLDDQMTNFTEALSPKRPSESQTEMVQVVLPNDANLLGFILGGTVMHLIDIAGAIACHRHTRTLLVTAAVDGLQFLHPIKVGDLIILKSRVTCTFTTSLEVEVEVNEGSIAKLAKYYKARGKKDQVTRVNEEGRVQKRGLPWKCFKISGVHDISLSSGGRASSRAQTFSDIR